MVRFSPGPPVRNQVRNPVPCRCDEDCTPVQVCPVQEAWPRLQENEIRGEEQDGTVRAGGCFDEDQISPKKELIEQAAPAGHPDESRDGQSRVGFRGNPSIPSRSLFWHPQGPPAVHPLPPGSAGRESGWSLRSASVPPTCGPRGSRTGVPRRYWWRRASPRRPRCMHPGGAAPRDPRPKTSTVSPRSRGVRAAASSAPPSRCAGRI